jgi:hypothetical protein
MRVPPEVLSEIFSYCDQSTLAVVSAVSFACLELASRLLYEDVVLDDARSVERLLARHQVSQITYLRRRK